MSAQVIEWKRGDSFVVDEPGMLADGQPLDMTGWTVESQIRRKDTGELVATMAQSWTTRGIGAFRLEVKDTTAWPLIVLAWDVQLTDPAGYVASTPTRYIRCKQDETRA
jgi:hypothetical protein